MQNNVDIYLPVCTSAWKLEMLSFLSANLLGPTMSVTGAAWECCTCKVLFLFSCVLSCTVFVYVPFVKTIY